MNRPRLIFIVGLTATGKSEFALKEAAAAGAPILSCDSLCFYRGMDIGTAKPSPEEQKQVPHFGIDLCDPQHPFSVSDYIHYRDTVLERLRGSGVPVYVVGGSGFYLKSFFSPVVDGLHIPEGLEAEVERIHDRDGLSGLREALQAANPSGETFPGLDWNNPRRLTNALVRCLATGRSYSQLLEAFQSLPEPLKEWGKEIRLVVRSREDLQERNCRRVQRMLSDGLIDEVRRLRAAGFEENPSASRAIGYREVLEFLDGFMGEKELEQAIVTHTQQLMRKQRTWFRRQLPVDREIRLS